MLFFFQFGKNTEIHWDYLFMGKCININRLTYSSSSQPYVYEKNYEFEVYHLNHI
jgi:hypothetical protein